MATNNLTVNSVLTLLPIYYLQSSFFSICTSSLRRSISSSFFCFSSLHKTLIHLRGGRTVFGLFPPKWGCCNRFACCGVGITINEFSLSSSDQSDSDEPSMICSSFSFSLVRSGVATRMESSISFSLRQRSDSSCFFSSAVLRFLAGAVFLAAKIKLT